MGAHQPPLWRVILAGLIGNVMEWYDFALYGYFVGIFSDQFFPSSDPNASLIAALEPLPPAFWCALRRRGAGPHRRSSWPPPSPHPLGDGHGARHGLHGDPAHLPAGGALGPDRFGVVAHPARTLGGGEYTTSIVFWLSMPQPIAAAWSRSGGSGDRCWACCWAQPLNAALQQLERRPNAQRLAFPLPWGCWWPSLVGFAPRPP